MEKLRNGIYATAMNEYIYEMYEEFDFKTDDDAEIFLSTWLQLGVADGNDLYDNINDYEDEDDFNELQETFIDLCKNFDICPNYSKKVEEIKKNIVKMLDNPCCNMI